MCRRFTYHYECSHFIGSGIEECGKSEPCTSTSNIEVMQHIKNGKCETCSRTAQPVIIGQFESSTADVLRQTHFMGKPLLVENPCMSMSATARPGKFPAAHEFAAYHPDNGQMIISNERRENVFLRSNKASLDTKVHEKPNAPQTTTPPAHVSNRNPKQPAFSKPTTTAPAIWPAKDELSRSGLFTTPPTSPISPITSKSLSPEITSYPPQMTPVYKPYRPNTHASSTQYKPYQGKSPTKRVLTNSIQDTSYNPIDTGLPRPPQPIPTTLTRKFSFATNGPEDQQIIQASLVRSPENRGADTRSYLPPTPTPALTPTPTPSQPHPPPKPTTIHPCLTSSPNPEQTDLEDTCPSPSQSVPMPMPLPLPEMTTHFYTAVVHNYSSGRVRSRPRDARHARNREDTRYVRNEWQVW